MAINRYYRLYGKKYLGQWNGKDDLILYETGEERWLSSEEIVIELLANRRYVEAEHADEHRDRYVDWLEN